MSELQIGAVVVLLICLVVSWICYWHAFRERANLQRRVIDQCERLKLADQEQKKAADKYCALMAEHRAFVRSHSDMAYERDQLRDQIKRLLSPYEKPPTQHAIREQEDPWNRDAERRFWQARCHDQHKRLVELLSLLYPQPMVEKPATVPGIQVPEFLKQKRKEWHG